MCTSETNADQRTDNPCCVPVHSDFLIHWTGNDLDALSPPDRDVRASSPGEDSEPWQKYLDRLKSILKFGLWMTAEGGAVQHGDKEVARLAPTPRTCFTELKLSTARLHASRYGRLGIGFKRPFVVERGGRPVWYYPKWGPSGFWERAGVGKEILEGYFGCFLKPMNEMRSGSLDYTLYDESEWRIVYSDWLADKGPALLPREVNGFAQYMASLPAGSREPCYLLHVVSRWLAIIIYPDIQTKREATKDKELRCLLRNAKQVPDPSPVDRCKGPAELEADIPPMELILADCRNF